MRRIVAFTFSAVIAPALAMLIADAMAYETYTQSKGANTTNCGRCHGDFRASPYISPRGENWGDDLHDIRRNDTMLGRDCNTCHFAARNPVLPNSSAGGYGLDPIGCVGCHGCAEDRPDPAVASGDGAGLRQHHFNAGVPSCRGCHTDANPANYTPAGEDVAPPYYFTPDSTHWNKPTNTCSPYGEEDYAGSALGLDNDGDGAYDMADPDCGGLCSAVVCPPTGNGCALNVCDPADGLCKPQDVADGTSCNDGSFCTAGDTCIAGTCTAGSARNCDDGLFCTGVETCNEATDSCESSGNPCDPATEICDEMTDSCTPL